MHPEPTLAQVAVSTANTTTIDEEKAPVDSVTKDAPAASHTVSALFPSLGWIPANWSWSKGKPVLRSALAGWINLVLVLVPEVLDVMGQAAFLVIIASFLSPPSEPFIVVLEREFSILTFVTLSSAWMCLGLFVADLARSDGTSTPSPTAVVSGQYLEAGPTTIIAVFLFIGAVFFLYLKSRWGPGPSFFACIFGLISIDIISAVAVVYPYPYYQVGITIVVTLALHSAVAITLSICVFPSSISALFTARLRVTLSALVFVIQEHRQHLQQDITSPEFSARPMVAAVDKAESALPLLTSAARLLKVDIIYSRFAPMDYTELHSLTRKLVAKANGMNTYYTLIDPTRERFPISPCTSTPATPKGSSPSPSRPPTPERDHHPHLDGVERPRTLHRHHSAPLTHHRAPQEHHSPPHPPFSRSRTLHTPPHVHQVNHRRRRHSLRGHISHSTHSSLLHVALSYAAPRESPVGVFESHRYLNLEAVHLSHPNSERYVASATTALCIGSQDLLQRCESALQGVCDWLASVGDNRFNFWVNGEEKQRLNKERIKKYEALRSELSSALEEFVNDKRLGVCAPYREMFADNGATEPDIPPHRPLFHCYVFQYHLMRFATGIQDMLDEILRLENERRVPKIWFPKFDWSRLVPWSTWEPSEMVEKDDDEDPDKIPGLEPTGFGNLGKAVRRDPDALPPQNVLETTMNWLYEATTGMGGGNMLFALKGGILTIILALPSFIQSSAESALTNKYVWAVIMGQLTLARFRGDTTFGLIARFISSFVGGFVGTVMWYISTGTGTGSAYGLGAVCLVCFPAFFFFHLYSPIPPITNMIIFITAALVFGYSYQDTHLVTITSPGYGIDIAWKRFVLVAIGVMGAGFLSFLPPSTTIRSYQRRILSTTASELGSAYCSVVSYANTRREGETAMIVQRLLAIQSKLKRSRVLKTNVVYEFSLRGKWPAQRYQRILDLQIQILTQLTHLMSVVEQLEPAWTHAFLKRTRMLDSDFQGDVLAVISLISSSLRTGNPLPQVTPCPLLDRFMERRHGLKVIHEDSEDDFGLPRMITSDMIESLQYLIFCVGVMTAFGIVTSLDKLMVAVKELVGEQYHIDGVGIPLYHPPRMREVLPDVGRNPAGHI